MPSAPQKSASSSDMPETMSVATAKAKFSSLINGVEKKHTPVTILRRGVPVAQIVPFPGSPKRKLRGSMAGKGRELGDIVTSFADEWTVSDWPVPHRGSRKHEA